MGGLSSSPVINPRRPPVGRAYLKSRLERPRTPKRGIKLPFDAPKHLGMKHVSRQFSSRLGLVPGLVLLFLAAGTAAGGGPNGTQGSSSPAPGKQLPANTSPATVSGSAVVGMTLTADPGSWSGNGVKLAVQWQRCDALVSSCADVGGATGSTIALQAADAGYRLRVVVTASNNNGSSSATSSASDAVAPAPVAPAPTPVAPSSTTSPSISGTATQGQTLTATTGSWTGTQPIAYGYRWRRCDSSGSSCTALTSATTQTYALTSADVGSTMRVDVTASNTGGSAIATSGASPVVASSSSTAVSTSSGLTWAPPALSNPITVQIQDTGQACPSVTSPWQNPNQPWICYLDPTRDYILKLNHRQVAAGQIGGVVITGGRNVVIVGGWITLAAPTDATLERQGLTFHNQTGTVHVEGVLVDGWPRQCIVLDSAQATFQIENFRCEGVSMYNENFSTAHSDTLMTWKSPPLIRIDKFTADYDGTGFALYGSQQPDGSWTYPGTVIVKRTNIRTMSKSLCSNFSKPLSHMYVSSRRQTRIELNQFFAQTGWGRASITTDCPAPGSFQFTLPNAWATLDVENGYQKTQKSYGDGISAGSYFEFTNPTYDNVWGVNGAYARVDYGVPPGGDFVPSGVAGTSYTSPGYTG
jgi:hypothetical protein